MKTACYLSLIILYYHRSLSNILTIYATNCPCDELSMRRIVHATNCPCDELSMRRIVRATNCPCDELSMRRIVHATNCPCDELSSHRLVDQIQYIDDHGQQKTIQCYFISGPSKGKARELLRIAKESKILLHDNIKLKELKEVLGRHEAFQIVRKFLVTIFNIITTSFITIFINQNWKKSLSNIILKLRSLLNFIVSSTALRVYGPTENNSFESKLIKRSRRGSILLQIYQSILSKETLQSSFLEDFGAP